MFKEIKLLQFEADISQFTFDYFYFEYLLWEKKLVEFDINKNC